MTQENALSDRSMVLVVDDAEMIRTLVRSFLEKTHEILEAEDGEEGLAMAMERKPDLIITDLMMPEMDGYQLIRAIRANDGINHIPVIMLTSVDTELNKLEGYKLGIDAYLVKPFTADELAVRVDNLIRNRRLTIEHINRTHRLKGADYDGMSIDNEFIHKMDRFIEKNLSNPDLKVHDIAEALSMSLPTFERRLKNLFGTTPKLYIRDYRLTKAAQMLKQRRGNVSEIASFCGFDNNSYFAVCFKEKYQITPSEMLGSALPNYRK